MCVYEVLMHARSSVTVSPLCFILAYYKLLFWEHNEYQIGSKHRITYFIIVHFFIKMHRVQTGCKTSLGRFPESFELEKKVLHHL